MTAGVRRRRASERSACWGGLWLALACGGGGSSGASAGNAGQSAGPETCGALDRACCEAPRFACARGLWCDAVAGVCREGASGSPGASLLCQTDADCAPARRCCSAGNYGLCQALEPGAACPLPDLGVLASGEGLTLEQEAFDGSTPAEGGCVRDPGVRSLLRVPVAVANFGAADFILGERDAPRSAAAGERDEFLRYSLLDLDGEPLVTSRGPFPCNDPDPSQAFDCDFAGLAAGALMPARGHGCEALDVTGVPAGSYRVRVALAHAWPDADPSNDQVELPVALPSFNPLDACPETESLLLGSSIARECGWSPLPAPGGGTCRPGDPIGIDCQACQGVPILRLCAGDAACQARSALAVASAYDWMSYTDAGAPCTTLQGHCPQSGRYNVLIGDEDPAQSASCTLAISPGF
jgi:hypothetical protein